MPRDRWSTGRFPSLLSWVCSSGYRLYQRAHVVVSGRRCVHVTSLVSKASEGALAIIESYAKENSLTVEGVRNRACEDGETDEPFAWTQHVEVLPSGLG